MDGRTTGIILRTRPLTETSLIVNWLTPNYGRLSTVAKGARRPKSPFVGKLDLFFLAELTFHASRSSDLHALREVTVREYHQSLRANLGYLQQACYFAQLTEQTTETGTPLPGIYELFKETLQALPQHPPWPLTVFAFEIKILIELGLTPDIEESRLTAGSRQILELAAQSNWPTLHRLRGTPPQRRWGG
jgi:DNA repair protein RecO (recombination protein O)